MADKITFTVLNSGYASVAALNANFTSIAAELNDKVLYRSTVEPNEMATTLDMNSNRVINLPTAVNASEPATKGYVDSFITGSTQLAGLQQEEITAAAGQTLITLASITYATGKNELAVYVNGVRQVSITETSTTSITLGGPLDAGDSVFIERRQVV